MDRFMIKAHKLVMYIEKYKTKILFLVILLIAIFTRLYRITDVPHGINVDEAGIAYDAYCLANNGTDRFLNKFPVYMINFGCGQSALYTYIDSIFIKSLGLNLFAIRLPAALFGITAIVLSYFMAKREKGEKFALCVMALITVCPWHIMASRWGLDCNLLSPMTIISMFFLLRAKNVIDYIFAGISFGLTLYTYALSYIIIPIFLFLTLAYMLYTKKIRFKNIIIMGAPIFLLAIPLMLMLLVNNEILDEVNTFITIPKMGTFRDTELGFCNIASNMDFFEGLVTTDNLVYNALPEYGSIYKFSIFLAVFGIFIEVNNIVKNIKKREFSLNSLMLFLFISVMGVMLVIKGPNINKANAAFIPLLFFTGETIRLLYRNYKVAFGIIVFLYAMNFVGFQEFYFNEYPIKYKEQIYFEKDLTEALNYVKEMPTFVNKAIYVNTTSQQPYIYTLLNDKTLPQDFNERRYKETYYKMSYGRYIFNSDNINEAAVYIIKEKPELLEKLESIGFRIEYLNSYAIAYK